MSSNVAILQMYNVAAKPKGSSPELFFTHVDEGETGLSSYVLNAVNPLSFFTAQKASPAVKAQLEQDSSTALYQLGLILVHGYLVFLFLYISAILLTRGGNFHCSHDCFTDFSSWMVLFRVRRRIKKNQKRTNGGGLTRSRHSFLFITFFYDSFWTTSW
jgi:hypothetical protein